MLAHIKIRTRQKFSERAHQASLRLLELCKGDLTKLSGKKKRALAIRAAHDCGLGYMDGEVDPLIIVAIFDFADPDKTEDERAKALLEAWEAYDRSWINQTLH